MDRMPVKFNSLAGEYTGKRSGAGVIQQNAGCVQSGVISVIIAAVQRCKSTKRTLRPV